MFSSIHQIHHLFSVWEQLLIKPFVAMFFGKKDFC